jgi:hypothetical protein
MVSKTQLHSFAGSLFAESPFRETTPQAFIISEHLHAL